MNSFNSWAAPSDAKIRLSQLSGSALLSFYRSLPWHTFLKEHLSTLSAPMFFALLQNIFATLPISVQDSFSSLSETSSIPDLFSAALIIYLLQEDGQRLPVDLSKDVMRNWSARSSDEDGRMQVTLCLDPRTILESTQTKLLPLVKALDGIGLTCSEVPNSDGTPSKFYTSRLKKSQMASRLIAFWEAHCPPDCVDGIIGRTWDSRHTERQQLFQKAWNEDLVENLETDDARTLFSFLTETAPSSPSASSARKLLLQILNASQAPPQKTGIDSLNDVNFGISDEEQRSPILSGKPRGKRRLNHNRRFSHVNSRKNEIPTPPSLSSNDEHDGSSDEGKVHKSRPGFLKSVDLSGLGAKMLSILQQGGREFTDFFRAHRFEVHKSEDLQKLLELWTAGQQLNRTISAKYHLDPNPEMCSQMLLSKPVWFIHPMYRHDARMAIPATEKLAPRALRQWLTSGSLSNWVENLANRAENFEAENANSFLAREILTIGYALAAFLDEFHPDQIVHSNGIERLVRRMIVLEEAIRIDEKDRKTFYKKRLGFTGILPSAIKSATDS